MKKILVVVAAPLTSDGLTRIALDVFDYNRGKYEFAFATPAGTDEDIIRRVEEAGARFMTLPRKGDLSAYIRALREMVRSGQYDLVYIHGNSAFMIVEAKAARQGGAKVITHCHDTSSNHKLLHHLLKPFFNQCVDAKIGCSSAASAWAYDGKDVDTVPNGIDADKYRFDAARREEVRRELGITDETVVGFVGRLADQKNPLFLVEVFAEIVKLDPRASLLIVGTGDLEQAVRDRARALGIDSQMHMIGATEDVPGYYQAMDIVLLPSKYEGFGLVAVEAQACGLPVLMSDIFVDDVCVTEHTGRMRLSDGPAAWAQTALQMTGDIDRSEIPQGILDMTTDRMNEKIAAVIDRVMEV